MKVYEHMRNFERSMMERDNHKDKMQQVYTSLKHEGYDEHQCLQAYASSLFFMRISKEKLYSLRVIESFLFSCLVILNPLISMK